MEEEHFEEITEKDLFLFPEENELVMANFTDLKNSINKEDSSYNKEDNSFNKDDNSINKDINSYNSDGNSINKEDNSYNIELDSYNKNDNSYNREKSPFTIVSNSYNNEVPATNEEKLDIIVSHSTNEAKEEDLSSPEEIEERLWKYQNSPEEKRLSPSVMEEIIVRLCTQKPLMLKEMADLLGRTPDGLRNNYLAKLLTNRKSKTEISRSKTIIRSKPI